MSRKTISTLDLLKKIRRMPQVVLPKDVALIAAYTGLQKDWRVLDAGTGSGFLAIFLAELVKEVISYEKRKEFADNVKKQVKKLGIENLKIINKDVLHANVRGKFDLITLDMKFAEKAIRKLEKNLKSGGFFAIYSPHIEQVKEVKKTLEELNFESITTVENIVREWKVTETHTHPTPSGILHTGFLTFGRKVNK